MANSRQKIIGKDRMGRTVSIYEYSDLGRVFFDLHTDGRVLLTSPLARKLATALNKFTERGDRDE